MKVRCYAYVVLLFLVTNFKLFCHNNQERYIFIDTVDRERVLYKQSFDIIESLGIQVNYVSLDSLIDSSVQELGITKYQGVFFILGSNFFKSIHESPIANKVLELVKQAGKIPNMLVSLLVPPLRAHPKHNILSLYKPVFKKLGITVPQELRGGAGEPAAFHQG